MLIIKKSWTNTGFSAEQPSKDQESGGGRQVTKFMEIDGVIREVNAENNVVIIRRREKGDIDMEGKDKNQLEGYEGEKSGTDDGIAFDFKRKWVEGKTTSANKEGNPNVNLEDKIEVGSKNGLGASSGIQARQTL